MLELKLQNGKVQGKRCICRYYSTDTKANFDNVFYSLIARRGKSRKESFENFLCVRRYSIHQVTDLFIQNCTPKNQLATLPFPQFFILPTNFFTSLTLHYSTNSLLI